MKRKQLTALFLSAAMVLTNAGISFGALDGPEDVGKRGEVAEGKEAWITLNANGGGFRFAGSEKPGTPGVSTPSDATSSDATPIEETSTTLDVGGPVTTPDVDGYYYLLFGDAEPVAASAEANWNVLTDGPETKNGEMEFAGWYVEKDDLTTRLEPESKIYGHADVYARWVSSAQATVDSSVTEKVQDVKVSGLAENTTLTFKALEENKQKDVQALADIVSKADLTALGVSSVVLSQSEDALVQLDISADKTTSGSVGITMADPFKGQYDNILVLHLNDEATAAKDVQYAVMDKNANTLSFTAKGFSPYILAAVDGNMAKIKVENVKNGALLVYSLESLKDGGYKHTYVPIGEEVEIPVGTVLHVQAQGAYTDDTNWELKDDECQVTSDKETINVQNWSSFEVSGNAVISAEFVQMGQWEVTPGRIPAPAVYEGKITYYDVEADGTKTYRQVAFDTDSSISNDNELFTLENGVLKSKDILPLGQYTLTVSTEDGSSFQTIRITVGNIRIDMNPDYLPKAGSFEALLQVYLKENGQWAAKNQWSVELDPERNNGLNGEFSLTNNVLKSNGALELGRYYPNVLVKTPEGGSYRTGISVRVGVTSWFSVPVAKFERNNGEQTYTAYIAEYLKNVSTEEGAVFGDAKARVFEGYIKEIAMYGNHPFKGWIDENGKIVEDAQKLENDGDFYAAFEGYTPVKVETTGSTGKPEEPGKPEKPNKPDNTGNSSSRDEDYSSGSSSSSGRKAAKADTLSGSWKKDAKGWWFELSNGAYAKNQWGKINNVWYYFNAEGYMVTGWQQVDGQWYYLTEAEANQGAMLVGWHFDSNYKKWFYFGSDGVMLTGWQLIGGQWYYLNTISDGIHGAMAADTTIDGHYVNADGVWAN